MRFSKSTANCWTILWGEVRPSEESPAESRAEKGTERLGRGQQWGVRAGEAHWSRALVFRDGSSGRKFLYSSTSFSMDSSWLCSLFRSPGSVSRMWLVSCWAWG